MKMLKLVLFITAVLVGCGGGNQNCNFNQEATVEQTTACCPPCGYATFTPTAANPFAWACVSAAGGNKAPCNGDPLDREVIK